MPEPNRCAIKGNGKASLLTTAITDAMIIENAIGTPRRIHSKNPIHKEKIMA
jgi:hypothetical protein